MKKIIRILMVIFVLLLVFIFGVGNYFYSVTMLRDTRRDFDRYADEKANFDETRFKNLRSDTITIQSEFGYELKGLMYFHPDTVTRTMILHHGLTADRWTMLKYAQIYQDNGFNTFVYDARNHGESGGSDVCFGHCEKHDLETVVKFIKENFPSKILGIHGESFGGATTALHAELNESSQNVDFYILDCPYADVYDLFEHRLKADFGLPNLMIVESANLVTKLRSGFWITDVSPIQAIKNVTKPLLLIHGESDDYVPFSMGKAMFEAQPNSKEKLYVPNAGHAKSWHTDRVLYVNTVKRFLEKYVP